MDNVNLLSNISNNFTKLFKECQNGNTFLPPVFNTSSDIDTLIVLHQVLYILCNYYQHVNNSSFFMEDKRILCYFM